MLQNLEGNLIRESFGVVYSVSGGDLPGEEDPSLARHRPVTVLSSQRGGDAKHISWQKTDKSWPKQINPGSPSESVVRQVVCQNAQKITSFKALWTKLSGCTVFGKKMRQIIF